MKIKYLTANLFDMPLDTPDHKFIVHCCNDQGGWGSGFVVPLGKKYPDSEQQYRLWSNQWLTGDTESRRRLIPFGLGEIQLVRVKEPENDIGSLTVVNMIGQHKTGLNNGRPPIRYTAISRGLMTLADRICRPIHEPNTWVRRGVDLDLDSTRINASIHAPLFGAGLAAGNWDIIEQLLTEAFIDRKIPVTIYQMPGEELRPSENIKSEINEPR